MKKITILIKPVSSHCNMECKYCFYKDITSYRSKSVKKMSRNIYVSIIIKSLEFCFEPIEIEYCFQGGEPLLAGVEFFKDFINEVEIRNKIHTIHFSIQTNGTLMNKAVSYTHLDVYKRQVFLLVLDSYLVLSIQRISV